jgi:hypothetical protein
MTMIVGIAVSVAAALAVVFLVLCRILFGGTKSEDDAKHSVRDRFEDDWLDA